MKRKATNKRTNLAEQDKNKPILLRLPDSLFRYVQQRTKAEHRQRLQETILEILRSESVKSQA